MLWYHIHISPMMGKIGHLGWKTKKCKEQTESRTNIQTRKTKGLGMGCIR